MISWLNICVKRYVQMISSVSLSELMPTSFCASHFTIELWYFRVTLNISCKEKWLSISAEDEKKNRSQNQLGIGCKFPSHKLRNISRSTHFVDAAIKSHFQGINSWTIYWCCHQFVAKMYFPNALNRREIPLIAYQLIQSCIDNYFIVHKPTICYIVRIGICIAPKFHCVAFGNATGV